MANEPNTPNHRWYQRRYNIGLAPNMVSRDIIYDAGIQRIDSFIGGGTSFSPSSLFALAEPGVWYDPSDLTTLFQDTAGTMPVTAAGQPVALALDKSRGLVLGSELATGWLDSASGWTLDAGWSVASGALSGGAGVNGAFASRPLTTVVGRWYRIDITVASLSGGLQFSVRQGTITGTQLASRDIANTTGSYSLLFSAATTTSVVRFGDFLSSVLISSLSIRELPGFHATQATTASRPTYQVVSGRPCLSFDGVDDFLQTSTITPGIDKVQVFAGARYLTNTTAQDVVAYGFPLNGSFALMSPRSAGVNHISWRAGGTSIGLNDYSVSPPVTFVVAAVSDIPSDVLNLRYNSINVSPSIAEQGTGNYLAYPLFIGRRGGTTLPFSGNIFSLIVRFGTNLDASTISSTETWVNSKTGAF